MTEGSENSGAASSFRSWWAVALLCFLYIGSFLDRLIPAMLVGPLKADFKVSDVEIGFVFGTAFAMFYAVVGVPIARLADRGNRWLLVVCGCMLWGACTAGSAAAGGFQALVLLRIGLALGEAVLLPSGYSLISDLFPPSKRAFAGSIFQASGVAGTYLAYIIGGAVVGVAEGWSAGGAGYSVRQITFVLVALPTFLLGALFALTVREPPRGDYADSQHPGFADVVRHVRTNIRLFAGLFVGVGLLQVACYGLAAWGPEMLHRTFGWSIGAAGRGYGIAGLLGGTLGALVLPQVTRRLELRGYKDGVAIVGVAMSTLGTVALLAGLTTNVYAFLVAVGVGMFCFTGSTANALVLMPIISPPRMRGTLVAFPTLITNLLALGIGPVATAGISNAISPDGTQLRLALAVLTLTVGIPATFLLLWSRGGFPDLALRSDATLPVGEVNTVSG